MNRVRLTSWLASTVAMVVIASPGRAHAGLLISNGDFETGSLSSWTVANQLSSTDYSGGTDTQGGFYAQGTGGTLPVSGDLTGGSALAPYSGTTYALSDSTAAGAHALIQSFTVPTAQPGVTLSFAMYTYDWYGNGAVGTSLDSTSNPNQHVRVDILTANAGAFDTSASGVVANLFNGELPQSSGPAWQTFNFSLTGIVLPGQTYQLRFAEVDNQFTLNMGVDAVSLTSIATVVPEPSTWVMVTIGVPGSLLCLRRSWNSKG